LRHIAFKPDTDLFVPAGTPMRMLEQVSLTLDELEALRLADLQGLYQEEAAKQMKVSRQTFARIVEKARRKVADALIHGRALRLEGGVVRIRAGKGTSGGQNRLCPCGCGARQEAGCRKEENCDRGKCRKKNKPAGSCVKHPCRQKGKKI